MKHNIIQTENYLFVVDESEIKEASIILANDYSGIAKVVAFKAGHMLSISIPYNIELGTMYHELSDWKKIIAHLPLNNSPILEGVPLLPPIEDDEVEKLADEIYPETYYNGIYVDGWLKAGFIKGYNKAKERFKYTEDDLRKAIDMVKNDKRKAIDTKGAEYFFSLEEDEIIQSLQQPKMPIGFKRETERKLVLNLGIDIYNPNTHVYSDEPKTTTNSQGQTVWIGKYIY